MSELVARQEALAGLQRTNGHGGGKPAHGSFDTAGANYRLLDGEGCRIYIAFNPGKTMPRGTQVSFIQAIKTVQESKGGEPSSAATVDDIQAADKGFARIDQFLGNPSAYYLDYIDERLIQLGKWAELGPKRLGFDVRIYSEYAEMSMGPITKEQFDLFWARYDDNDLGSLLTVQEKTGQTGITQQEGRRAPNATGYLGFIKNLVAWDTPAKLYDEPKHNIIKPANDGDKSTCVFHTAAVTKVSTGKATVWDIVEWGYTVERIDGAEHWELIDMRHLALGDSMMKGALEAMIKSTPAYRGPTSLASTDED